MGKEIDLTIKVDGMMCEKCAAHVKDAVLKIEGITDVQVDFKSGKVSIIAKKEIKDHDLDVAIAKAGYSFAGRI